MKKITYFGLAATALLCACDPVEEGGSFDPIIVAQSTMDAESFITFVQTDKAGNPAADGNYISYSTNPATTVVVYNIKGDAENVLAKGPSGSFVLAPGRGSDPNQQVFVRAINSDRSEVVTSRTINVFVKQDLEPEMKLLASNSGVKTWKWDAKAPDGQFWGNMGYAGGTPDWNTVTEGKWWGVTSEEEFLGQLGHSNTGVATGEESLNATMVINEDGEVVCYNANGEKIQGRGGTVKIENWDANAAGSAWKMGDLVTSEGAILFPFEINSGGNMPTKFDLCYLSVDKMVLVYPDKGDFGGLGGWGEATFWRFASTSDVEGLAESYSAEGKKWGWDDGAPDGQFWGNMGYAGGSPDWSSVTEGKWWGVTSEEELVGQKDHAAGLVTGEESLDAYMVFKGGEISKYTADGTKLAQGAYSVDLSTADGWKVGTMTTDPGLILFPYEINSGGNKPTTFDLCYISGTQMVLVYPDKGDFAGLGGWGEATFWRFKAK